MTDAKTIESLKKINNLFQKEEIDTWLDTGTLLGAVRNNGFIPWDTDIDIGEWHDDVKKIENIEDEIKKMGFNIAFFDFKDYIKIMNKHCEIDINLYHKKRNLATRSWYINKRRTGKIIDYLLWLFSSENPVHKKSKVPRKITRKILPLIRKIPDKHRVKIYNVLEKIFLRIGSRQIDLCIPSDFFDELSDVDLYDIKFKAPSPTKKYLEFRYGSDWMIPNKNYVYYKDDGAIIKK